MTDSEKFEAQGRAYSGLKEAKSNIATLRTSMEAYRKRLHDSVSSITRFLENPAAIGGDGQTMAEYIKSIYRSLRNDQFEANADELAREVQRESDLQKLIDNF